VPAKLPAAEREACRQLWAEVEALLVPKARRKGEALRENKCRLSLRARAFFRGAKGDGSGTSLARRPLTEPTQVVDSLTGGKEAVHDIKG
jgi:hypothetical protein